MATNTEDDIVEQGGPAFPGALGPGLSRADWFMGQALAGILANPELCRRLGPNGDTDELEFNAVEMAASIASKCL